MNTMTCSMYLALRDWLHEFRLSICSVLALVSMLTPLLLLHGVHTGIILGLKQRLLTDPSVLVVIPSGLSGAGYTEDFFEELRKLPETDYVIGRTRDVAAELQLRNGERFLTASLEPTSNGDPLLRKSGLSLPETVGGKAGVLLSASAARKLQAGPGSRLEGSLARRLTDGKRENTKISLEVAGVLPQEATGMDTAFVLQQTLLDIQDYRDGLAVPDRGWPGEQAEGKRHFESFRLYAVSLEAVERLDAHFGRKNIQVKTKAKEIASIRGIDTAISMVVLVIGSAVCVGFVAFMFSSIQAVVKRKEKMLGLLSLSSFTQRDLLLFPLSQSVLTGFFGGLLAIFVYWLVSFVIDGLFSGKVAGAVICTIPLADLLLIHLAVIMLSAFASLSPAITASRIQPALVIRQL